MKNFRSKIKKVLPDFISDPISRAFRVKNLKPINDQFNEVLKLLLETSEEKRIILIGTAVYGNIGDHAISNAEVSFFNKEFPDITLIEIPISLYEVEYKKINTLINSKDLIIINGGGFLGTLWEIGQNITNKIIASFPNNKIIIFPQTVYYKENSQELISKHELIVNEHPNLSIIVRDEKSFEFIQKSNFEFKNVLLTPDIVSYIEGNDFKNEIRENITFILRHDHEKINNRTSLENIINIFNKYGFKNNIVFTDTVVEDYYNYKNRNIILTNFLSEIGNSKFVVSDRLHGFILAVICGVPVIALDNVSRKVFGAYQWFSKLPYVLYFEEENLEEKIKKLLEDSNFNYTSEDFREYHLKIKELVSKEFYE